MRDPPGWIRRGPRTTERGTPAPGKHRGSASSRWLFRVVMRRGRTDPPRPLSLSSKSPPEPQFRMFTLRAITSASSTNPVIACTIMNSFARMLRGITSVGLNAIALDAEKYR